MKKQHETFIAAMAEHGDPIKSYLAAYPKATEASARTAAYRLLQHPEIAKAVSFDAKQMYKKAKAAAIKKGTKRVTQQLADIQKRREVLAQMIFGTFKRKRLFKLNGELMEAEEDIPSQSVLRAIELDCKLEAGFDWTGRRTAAAEKKEKQEPPKAGPDNPIEPKPDDITGVIILIGDTLFEKKDAEWIERYTAWKKANPEKVKEWTVETEARVDRYIQLDDNYDRLQRNWKRNGTHSLIQVMRFGNGRPRGPFIPGESRYFTSYEDEHTFYGTKPFNAAHLKQKENMVSMEPPLLSNIQNPTPGIKHPASSIEHQTSNLAHQQKVTIQLPSNPPQSEHISQNRKVYHNSDELWEAYKAALPAWPHLSEKTRRFVEQTFRNADMEKQRWLLSSKLGHAPDKNSAA